MSLPIKNLYRLLKSTTVPERLVLGGGIFTGGYMMNHLLDKAHANSMWSKIKNRYWQEMSDWKDPEGIFHFVMRTSPELSDSPETIWVMMKQVNEQGGANYAVAKSLIDMESGVSDIKRQRSESVGQNISAFHEKTSSAATKYIPGLIAGGLMAGGAGVLGMRLAHKVHADGDRKLKWLMFKSDKGQLIYGWEKEAEEYFNLLYNRAPFLMKNNDVVYSFLKHMRDQGGADIATLTDLIGLAQKKEKINSSKAKGLKAVTDVIGDLSLGMFGDAL